MKWFGAAIIIIVSYLCGNLLSSEENKKLVCLDSLIALLGFMLRRISSERTPLYEIFVSFSDAFLEERGFLPLMRSHRGETNRLWIEAIDLLPLERETQNELARFGTDLGRLNLDEQEKRIMACTDMLVYERDKLKSILPAKQKSIRAVCLLIGVMTAILLL